VFDETERLILEYAERMTKTPVEIPDELFEALQHRFDEPALVELTGAIAWENFRARFNHAFGLEAEGYSEGAFCPLPDTARESSRHRT